VESALETHDCIGKGEKVSKKERKHGPCDRFLDFFFGFNYSLVLVFFDFFFFNDVGETAQILEHCSPRQSAGYLAAQRGP
jgi:hypothetical protein